MGTSSSIEALRSRQLKKKKKKKGQEHRPRAEARSKKGN